MFGLAVETAGAAVTSVAIMNSVEASNRSPCDIIILRLAPPRGAYKCYVYLFSREQPRPRARMCYT